MMELPRLRHCNIPTELRSTHQVTTSSFELYTQLNSFSYFIQDNIYIADYGNHRIRKVTISTGIITTIAGTGTGSYSGDIGPATSAALNSPYDISLDASGMSNAFMFIFLRYVMFPFSS